MRAPWKRAAAIALATCGISFLPLINGCKTDVDRTDEAIRTDLDTATSDLADGKSNEATQALMKVSGVKGASPESQIEYNSLLAQSEGDAANSLMRRLTQQEAQITGILNQMQVVGWQMVTNNADLTAFQNLNPTQGTQAYQQAITSAQQGEGGAWVKGEPPIPALSDVTQRIDALQKQIDDLNRQKKDLSDKRAAALQSADKFDQQADSSRGSDSLGFYTQASSQRKEAADDDTRIRALDLQIKLAQQQLDVAKGQQQGIDAAVQSTQGQAQQLQTGWQNIQRQIEAARDYNKSLLSGGGAAPEGGSPSTQPSAEAPSLSVLASQLEQATKTAQDLRSQALSLLTGAMGHYTAAADAAKKRNNELTTMLRDAAKLPEKRAWQDLININQPSGFQLAQASVLGRMARVYADQYIEMAQRNALARLLEPALKQIGGDVPQAIATIGSAGAPSPKVRETVDKIEADMNKPDFTDYSTAQQNLQQLATDNGSAADQQAIASANADLYYFWADSLLGSVLQGSGQGDLGQLATSIAHAQRMIDAYGWAQLASLTGKSQEQRSRLSTARDEYKALEDAKATYLVPSVLPPGLLPEAPTSQPTTEPTSQPSADQGGTTQQADTSEQADIRKVAVAFADAINAGDFDKAKALSTNDSGQIETIVGMIKAFNSFKEAAQQKLGAGNLPNIPMPDLRQQARDAQITVTGDTATLVNQGDPEPGIMRRVNGEWKIDVPGANPTKMAQQLQVIKMTTDALEKVTAGIQSGQIKNAGDLRTAFSQAMQAAATATPPAGGATTAPAQ